MMCLAKVKVSRPSRDEEEVKDVVDIVIDGPNVRVSTLFGEERAFAGVAVTRIDLQAGIISLVEEQGR
jgi:predicted RNA-binding protein